MPYSIAYKPPGMITLRFEGPLTMEVVRNATVDVYNLPNLFAEIASTAGLQVYKFKRAMVISEDQELLPFFENVSRNRLHKVRLFHAIEAAEQWLFEP